jgi:hypothetical protein
MSQEEDSSIYEMGPDMDSLTHSLEHLDSQVKDYTRCLMHYW